MKRMKFPHNLAIIFLGAGACLSAGMAALAAAPAGDVARGQVKAQGCIGCHGIDGWRNAYPAYSVPKLGGQHPGYIQDALKGYQSGTRTHSTMHAIAVGLTEQDMADLAAYFASLGAPKPPSASTGAAR